MARILLAEDDEIMRIPLFDHLINNGWEVDEAADGNKALSLMEKNRYHVVISDIRMPGLDGISLMEKIKQIAPHTEVILMTAFGSVENAVDCLRKGAADYILKPFDMDDLSIRVNRLLAKQMMEARCASLDEDRSDRSIVGTSQVMKNLIQLVDKVAISDASVLITGESGTGKELVAAAIHNKSNRAQGPYIKINCGAIPETLIESELFGHEKGAFTDAHARKIGKFEQADQGTILLDEIGDMPYSLQVKLLRVLQEKEIERIGGKGTVAVDVRVICSTAKNIEDEVEKGSFRKDLFYRLNVVPITVPLLRDRPGDIPELCDFFLQEFNVRRTRPLRLSAEALDSLTAYNYPGNIRELRNIIERATVLVQGEEITPADLPADLTGRDPAAECTGNRLADAVAHAERNCILKALGKCSGNKTETAARLGISRKNLWEKMRQYRLGD